MALGAPLPSYPMTGTDNTLNSYSPRLSSSSLPPISKASSSPSLNQPPYFQQTTTFLLCSTIALTLTGSLLCLLLFSWVRTRRSSIYGSRQFFVREEHRADPLPSGFFSWIGGVLFLESELKRKLEMENDEAARKQEAASASAAAASVSQSNSDGEMEGSNQGESVMVSHPQPQTGTLPKTNHNTTSGFWGRIGRLSMGLPADIKYTQNKANNRRVDEGNKDTMTGERYPQNKDISTASVTWSTSGHPNNLDRLQAPQSSDNISKSARDILISKIGLDHYLLIRFLRMLSSLSVMSVVLAIAVLVPLYNIGQSGEDMDIPGASFLSQTPRIEAMHIGNATDNERLLATVMVTAVISALITLWTWTELVMFLKLRKDFLFRSSSRYSSKVVLLQRIPKGLRSVSALKQVLSTAPGGGVEHVYLIRDAATLEKAVKRRQVVLDKLEEAESRYMAAIARASALVSATSFSMRSRSWLGKGLDHLKACFGCGGIDAGLVGNQGEDDYVGPLKMYQIEGVPKISLTDLSAPEDASSSTLPGTEVDGGVGIRTQHHKNSGGSNTSKLAALNWFQKPKRPSHYNGIPFLSKRQDSIRYYRGELCRLNKVILQAYEEQALAMAAEKEYKEPGQRQANARRQGFTNTRGVIAQEKGKTSSALQSDTNNDSTPSGATENGKGDLIASKSSEAKVLSSAFVLMRTRAGAKAVASGAIASDKIPSSARNLGIPPRDIEWRVLGQSQSRWSGFICRIMIPVVGMLLVVGCGLVVAAISSMAVFDGWERVSADDAEIPVALTIHLRQGVAAPILLTILMIAASWILNELCQCWGRVSKTQTELLIQRSYFFILGVSIGLVHPIMSLSFSWQETISLNTNAGSLADFLVHAIPSYGSFAFSYILVSGLALPFYQLLQLPRLWATLPTITLWSALEPLSWRKVALTRDSSRKGHLSHSGSIAPLATSGKFAADTSNSTAPSSTDSNFGANFIPTPTLTPRQAFQLRQPPFFSLQNLYPHLILMFALSITLLPLAPVLFLLWLVVLAGLNLCYRYLVLQVVATKSQSGGLHYLQALKLILFPTLACPPLLLAVYLGVRQAWIQCGFASVIAAATLISRVVIGVQFKKREEVMLRTVEEYHMQPKMPLLDSNQDFDLNTEAPASAQTSFTAVSSPQTSVVEFAPSTHTGHSVAFSEATKNGHVEKSEGPLAESPDDLDTHKTPYRRRVGKRLQRPTTIIGQVRSSIFGGISPSGLRPKSVFDIDRYEKEIMGLGYEQNKHQLHRDDLDELQLGFDMQPNESNPNHENLDAFSQDIFQSENARQENDAEGSSRDSFGEGHEFPISFDSVLSDTFDINGGYAIRRAAAVDTCTLSKAELEEEQREAKYREIVKALRRASSVATGKYPGQIMSGANNSDMIASPIRNRQRRVHITSAPRNQLSSQDAGGESSAAGFSPRRAKPGAASQATKAQFRKSLPALLNPRPLNYKTNPYLFHQPSIADALSNVSLSSGLSANGNNRGFPSLPMLLIHRESAVAAKEKNRIQNLYYNPVLQEAMARVIVWLPSQTERSFWGAYANDGAWTGHCKYHAELRQKQATTAITIDPAGSVEDLSIHDRSSFGLSTSTLAPTEQAYPNGLASYHRSKCQCTCQLYQQVTQAVADAVALADQEIRDLRIVGLTVWLDSRHVIWGHVNEEDGRLGDRVMISTGPQQLSSESTVESVMQKQVGDGLLSWLEAEELEDDENGEMHNNHLRQIGQGAAGIIGGSMGLIMKRPIGYYGKLVGDGEEDDISRGC